MISVGNIAFGGRGKTPTVAHIARLLMEMGERPAILSRGYGRRRVEDGVVVVSDGKRLLADLDRAGDEPLMLARELPGVPVLVCEQRAIAGALASHVLGATALVLDDGFQHRQMARDVDLVLVAPEDLKGRRAPLGRLRESPSALSRADAVISTADGAGGPADFSVQREATPAPVPSGTRVFVLAGIADPDRFTRSAVEAGLDVAGSWAPGDHHRYTAADMARLARDMESSGASCVLTTSKDAVRLMPLRPWPFEVYEWPHRITIEPANGFAAWLKDRFAAARATAELTRAESA